MTRFQNPMALVALSVALLAGCTQSPIAGTAPGATPVETTAKAGSVILQGHVDFSGFRVATAEGDVTSQAVVSLMAPDGTVKAAGVTDAAGNFTLYQNSAAPLALSGYYILEVMKQVSGANGVTWAALRTKVNKTGAGPTEWDSITGYPIKVNAITTAIAKTQDVDPAVSYALIMQKYLTSTVATFGTHTDAEIRALATSLLSRLSAGEDPSSLMIYKGDVYIDSPDDLAGYAKYEVIDGDLTITGSDPTLTKANLPVLRLVTGGVGVSAEYLTDLTGLEKLTTIGDYLQINDAAGLTTLNGLTSLTKIGGTLRIQDNPSLANLNGLEHLASVHDLMLYQDEVLESIDGLSGLKTITQDAYFDCLAGLNSLRGLSALESVGGDLAIGVGVTPDMYPDQEQTSGLSSLEGLEALETIGGSLILRGNAYLASLYDAGTQKGLKSLTGTLVGLTISENDALVNLNGLGGLTAIDYLTIENNDDLEDISGLSSYASGISMFIQGNCAVTVSQTNPFPRIGPAELSTFSKDSTIDNTCF